MVDQSDLLLLFGSGRYRAVRRRSVHVRRRASTAATTTSTAVAVAVAAAAVGSGRLSVHPRPSAIFLTDTRIQVVLSPPGSRVCVLVHGCELAPAADVPSGITGIYRDYFAMQDELAMTGMYDMVIGFLWIGESAKIGTHSAVSRIDEQSSSSKAQRHPVSGPFKSAFDLRQWIAESLIQHCTMEVDVLAFGVGADLALQALHLAQPSERPFFVRNLFLCGATIPEDALSPGGIHDRALLAAQSTVVFYSPFDSSLCRAFEPLVHFIPHAVQPQQQRRTKSVSSTSTAAATALVGFRRSGHLGKVGPSPTTMNVTKFNLRENVLGPRDYFCCSRMLELICKTVTGSLLGPIS